MKTISTEYQLHREDLINLLNAANTGEEIIFGGLVCVVKMDPKVELTNEQISNIDCEFPCYYNNTSFSRSSYKVPKGLFGLFKKTVSELSDKRHVEIIFREGLDVKMPKVSTTITIKSVNPEVNNKLNESKSCQIT